MWTGGVGTFCPHGALHPCFKQGGYISSRTLAQPGEDGPIRKFQSILLNIWGIWDGGEIVGRNFERAPVRGGGNFGSLQFRGSHHPPPSYGTFKCCTNI